MGTPETFSRQDALEFFDLGEPQFKALKEMAARLGMTLQEADVFRRNKFTDEMIPKDPYLRRGMAKYLQKHETLPPKWMLISGLLPELYHDAKQRRERVRRVWQATVLLIRRELIWNESEQADTNVCPTIKGERSVYWDPVPQLTALMELSQSKLSAFCVEHTGSNLVQTIDNVRAESLKRKMRREIREFVVQLKIKNEKCKMNEALTPRMSTCVGPLPGGEGLDAHGAINAAEIQGAEGLDKWAVFKAWKTSRKFPEFCLNSWAQGFGFASYRRMYRACRVAFKKTPYQLVMELIEEALRCGEKTEPVVDEYKEWTLPEVEEAVRGIQAYPLLQ
jgi:hypothetical protein